MHLLESGGLWPAGHHGFFVKTTCYEHQGSLSGCTQHLPPFGRVPRTPPSLCPFFTTPISGLTSSRLKSLTQTPLIQTFSFLIYHLFGPSCTARTFEWTFGKVSAHDSRTVVLSYFSPQKTFGNMWRHSGSSQLKTCYGHLMGRGLWCC